MTIQNIEQLKRFHQQLRSLLPVPGKKVDLQLVEFSLEENQRHSAWMTQLFAECGCTMGSFFMSAGFVGTVANYFLSGGNWASVGMRQVVWLLVITLLFAIGGKLLGLLRARIRLLRYITEMLNHLNTQYHFITIKT